MVLLDELKVRLSAYEEPLKDLRDSLYLASKKERIEELERTIEEPGFWDNPDQSRQTMQVLKSLSGFGKAD